VSGVRVAGRSILVVGLTAVLTAGSVPIVRAAPVGGPRTDPPAALAPIDAPGPTQVVVYDRATRTSSVVSHDQAGTPGAASSSRPSVSADGAFVAFESDAPLVPDDTNGKADIYVSDRAADAAQRVSVRPNGAQANGASHDPSISGDGGVVAFTSTASNLTSNRPPAGTSQVFAWQRAAGVSLVSITGGKPGAGSSGGASVSLDGRVVAFDSLAADLVKGDTNGVRDVFLRDLVRGAAIRASVQSTGRQIAEESRRPSVSGDGGAVAFDSASAGLTPGDSNGVGDVFVRDLPPAVQVTPGSVDFGVVPLGTPANQGVSVVSVGWTPVAISPSTISGPNAGDFVVADDACAGQVLPYGASCAIVVLHIPTATGTRRGRLSIADSALDSPQVVKLVGGVPTAQVQLDPAVGPPGIVTVVTGSGFPPGALVSIRWDRGITPRLDPISVGPDGTFSVGVLVFHHDQLGPRQLLVMAASGGPAFPDRTAPFLAVPGPVQPPGASSVTFLSPELRLLIRR
jgi:hypothetical protein